MVAVFRGKLYTFFSSWSFCPLPCLSRGPLQVTRSCFVNVGLYAPGMFALIKLDWERSGVDPHPGWFFPWTNTPRNAIYVLCFPQPPLYLSLLLFQTLPLFFFSCCPFLPQYSDFLIIMNKSLYELARLDCLALSVRMASTENFSEEKIKSCLYYN